MRIACVLSIVLLLTGCSGELDAPTVEGVVAKLAAWADAEEVADFRPYMDEPSIKTPEELAEMILKSGMKENFARNLETPEPGLARLNYHDPDRGLHFQVDLKKNGDRWTVSRIWFCR